MNENEPKNFGVPIVDNTPTGLVNMEGNFYRGLTNNNKYRLLWVRIASVLFSGIFLLLPGLVVAFFAIAYLIKSPGENIGQAIIASCLGVLLIGAGISGIAPNIRKAK